MIKNSKKRWPYNALSFSHPGVRVTWYTVPLIKRKWPTKAKVMAQTPSVRSFIEIWQRNVKYLHSYFTETALYFWLNKKKKQMCTWVSSYSYYSCVHVFFTEGWVSRDESVGDESVGDESKSRRQTRFSGRHQTRTRQTLHVIPRPSPTPAFSLKASLIWTRSHTLTNIQRSQEQQPKKPPRFKLLTLSTTTRGQTYR